MPSSLLSARADVIKEDAKYGAPMTTTVSAVITAINFRRPGLKPAKIASLLYFAQGHHLAWSGEPLFSEPLVAADRGVTVETPASSQSEPISREALLNSIGYTIDRYSALSPADLRTLIQASQPWQNARKPDAGPHIDLGDLRLWFLRPDETDDPDDERPNRAEHAEAEAYLAARITAGARRDSVFLDRPVDAVVQALP